MLIKKITEITSVVIKERQGKFLAYYHRLNGKDLMLEYYTRIKKDTKGKYFWDYNFRVKHYLNEFKEEERLWLICLTNTH